MCVCEGVYHAQCHEYQGRCCISHGFRELEMKTRMYGSKSATSHHGGFLVTELAMKTRMYGSKSATSRGYGLFGGKAEFT